MNEKEKSTPWEGQTEDRKTRTARSNDSTKLAELKEWARAYKTLGFNVIVCYPGKKEPEVLWSSYQNVDVPLEEVLAMLKPNSNIAVIQPREPKYVILDFDEPENFYEILSHYPIDFDRKTLIANTTRGFHVLCKVKNYDRRFKYKLPKVGGSVRLNKRHCTLVPPSVVNGVKRRWQYLSINEAMKQYEEGWSGRTLAPEEFMRYVENDDILEIDFNMFEKDGLAIFEEIVQIVKKHYRRGQRHNLVLALASFLKYKLPLLGFSFNEALNFTKDIVDELVRETHDEEREDRIRAVEDTFERKITEHNKTLSEIMGSDFQELKDLFRGFTFESKDKLSKIIADVQAYVYEDNKIKIVFANGDKVEFSPSNLLRYVEFQYSLILEEEKKKEFQAKLLTEIQKKAMGNRLYEIKTIREGIHKVSCDEFVLALGPNEVFVYNTKYDDLNLIEKFYGNTVIQARKKMVDFDTKLMQQLFEVDKKEIFEKAKEFHEKLVEYLENWNFEKPVAPRALASLLLILPTHTAWNWRPIIHIIGSAGVGKTTLFENTFLTLYPTLCRKISDSTKAGVLQAFSGTSHVLLIDNFETTQSKKSGFFTMLEGASSGYEETKGTKDGIGVTYTFSNLVVVNSVMDFAEKEALDTRLVQFYMKKANGQKPHVFRQITAREIATYALVFSMRFWDKIQVIYEDLSHLGREHQNLAYIYAVDMLLNNTPYSEYETLLERTPVEKEEIQMLRRILNSKIRYEKGDFVVIDKVIELVRHREGNEEIARILSAHGLKVIFGNTIKVAFHYDRLVSSGLISREISKRTFGDFCRRLDFGKETVRFGEGERIDTYVCEFFKLCELVGFEVDFEVDLDE